MSGWIWMQGVDVAIADPIAPVVPEDKRESVKELIANHREKIDKVKESLEDDPLYDPANKHDDLWVLRFILSHKKKTKPALKAAKHTLQFREKHNLDDEDIRGKDPHKLKSGNVHEYWQKRCKGDAILTTHPDPKRGVIMFLLLGHMDPNAVNMLTEEVWNDAFIYSSEYTHQWLDYTTRTTGRMTRSVRIIDMRGSSISHFDRKSSQRDGKSKLLASEFIVGTNNRISSCDNTISSSFCSTTQSWEKWKTATHNC
jgi:hypothetical protein